MHALTRKIGAALGVLVAAAAVAGPAAGQAHAADPKVRIVQKAPDARQHAMQVFKSPVQTEIKVVAPVQSSDIRQLWIKHDIGNNVARYESVANPGKCMQVKSNISGEKLTVATCNGSAKQLWTQGFATGTFKKFQNVFSSRVATRERNIDIFQRFDTGLAGQKWAVKLA